MEEPSNEHSLLQRIEESAGTAYLNRAHQRSFSLNVFQMNAVDLMEAAHRVKDSDEGLALMMERNSEAGRQAHREINRHVHNFVSSALTLVEHTRVFMRKHYEGTEFFAAYERQVTATFAHSPVAQFVQGLRNYMLHRGLPNSSMYMTFRSDPIASDSSGTMKTGVHFETASLLDWTDWKPMARAYLETAGEQLELYEFSQEYLVLVLQFQGWLDTALTSHHLPDIQELGQLQTQLHAMTPMRQAAATMEPEVTESPVFEPFEFTAALSEELDQASSAILAKVREIQVQQVPPGFPTERPTTAISDHDLIGPVTFWAQETSGEDVFIFIFREGKSYGLSRNDYGRLKNLISTAMKSEHVRSLLSGGFVEKIFFEWARQAFEGDRSSYSKALSARAKDSVAPVQVWAPIANMEVEHGFDFGSVRIEPISAAEIDRLQSKAPLATPEQADQVNRLFGRLRQEIQGYAAVVVSMEAEPDLAHDRALQIAQDAVGLLRFFSPASSRSDLFSPMALVGAGHIPSSKLIVLRECGLILTEGMIPKKIGYWRLNARQISEIGHDLLHVAASLITPEGLTDFALAVRSSLLLHSKGTTLADPMDRLRNCLSAVEGVLLKHDMEPKAHSVANRMSYLLAPADGDREAVKQTVRKIYWLQDQNRQSNWGSREEHLIGMFTSCAYEVLRSALKNISTVSSKVVFVHGVDRLGLAIG